MSNQGKKRYSYEDIAKNLEEAGHKEAADKLRVEFSSRNKISGMINKMESWKIGVKQWGRNLICLVKNSGDGKL